MCNVGEKKMEYKLDLGAWESVFAVPGVLVDKHLKLAGAAQLKVILWILRHSGEKFTIEDISGALSMQQADVRDSMLYWKETGLLCQREDILTPGIAADVSSEELPAEKPPAPETPAPEPVREKRTRALSRPEKPDLKYLTKRLSEDESIVYLMNTADEIFGRPTNTNDKETLLMIHETDGLPVEVIIMLLQYAESIGKCNIRYIEKMAITWADEEIYTLDRAEEKIKKLTSGRSAAGIIQKLFGLGSHSPTEKETEYADRWLNVWGFSTEMIRKAYEICVDAKGKYIPKYVDSVLSRWYNSGIKTPQEADRDQNTGKNNKKKDVGKKATYDIEEYETTNVIFEEGY